MLKTFSVTLLAGAASAWNANMFGSDFQNKFKGFGDLKPFRTGHSLSHDKFDTQGNIGKNKSFGFPAPTKPQLNMGYNQGYNQGYGQRSHSKQQYGLGQNQYGLGQQQAYGLGLNQYSQNKYSQNQYGLGNQQSYVQQQSYGQSYGGYGN